MITSTKIFFVFAISCVSITNASPSLQPRAVPIINHDKVEPLEEAVTPGIGDLFLRHKPYLYVPPHSGCVPFPAVDRYGNARYVVTLVVYYAATSMLFGHIFNNIN